MIDDMALLSHPIEWLHDINIVDTPGTNAIIRRHQEITEEFVPRADLILFVTSADRPFSESERLFLHRIREWGKKIVFVVNKIDILETAADVDRIVAFVDTNGRELLGRRPVIFPISARLAQRAKETFDADERTRAWAGSRFERLEDYILHTLDERERLRLKLANPLGVAQLLTERYLGTGAGPPGDPEGRCCDDPHGGGAARRLRKRHAPRLQVSPEPRRQRALCDGGARQSLLRRNHPVEPHLRSDQRRPHPGHVRARGRGRHGGADRGAHAGAHRLDGGAGVQRVAGRDGVSEPARGAPQRSDDRDGERHP